MKTGSDSIARWQCSCVGSMSEFYSFFGTKKDAIMCNQHPILIPTLFPPFSVHLCLLTSGRYVHVCLLIMHPRLHFLLWERYGMNGWDSMR